MNFTLNYNGGFGQGDLSYFDDGLTYTEILEFLRTCHDGLNEPKNPTEAMCLYTHLLEKIEEHL